MSAQNESAKESLRESFANLRKALPEGITEADADLLQDVALRLMDRGLPRPAVFRYLAQAAAGMRRGRF